MDQDSSLIKVDLTKPATVLIEKISDAIGGLYRPFQIRRVAKAEAEAAIIQTEAEIECEELHRRALARFVSEEAKKQDNIESITRKAIPLLSDSSSPERMEDDWITNFFDRCRIISDEEMQILWSKVLAGEANCPGSFSKRTVNSLGSLDKRDAELFSSLCRFSWEIGGVVPLVLDLEGWIYTSKGISFTTLSHLDDIGLVSLVSVTSFIRKHVPRVIVVHYYGSSLEIRLEKADDNELGIGHAIFTEIGEQLARICDAKPVDGFFDYVIEQWGQKGLAVSSPLERQ